MNLPDWITRFEGITRFEKAFFHIWWVFLFILICLIVYEKNIYERNREYTILYAQMKQLQQQKEQLLEIQKDLQVKINSQSDPAWIELTLMKILGVVPEGYQKYYFEE